jgi:hypothetical protein
MVRSVRDAEVVASGAEVTCNQYDAWHTVRIWTMV